MRWRHVNCNPLLFSLSPVKILPPPSSFYSDNQLLLSGMASLRTLYHPLVGCSRPSMRKTGASGSILFSEERDNVITALIG
jgi:hypothetical protein